MLRLMGFLVCAPVVVLGPTGCDGGGTTGPVAEGTAAVRFAASPGTESGEAGDLVITGFNGTLTLTDVRIVVDDFELKRENDIAECSAIPRTDLCADLEIAPAIVDLPLTAGVTVVGDDMVPAGEYEEIEFDVVNLRGSASALLAQARALPGYADWPEEASIAARGTFTDAQSGEVRPFTVYFDLSAAVELEFRMTIAHNGTGTMTVHVDPVTWLTFQGAVVDLSAIDFASTGEVASAEFSFQSGLEISIAD